ncbi:hypothetical protein SteCoe_18878 [Stentor coeruleus]|uniref:Uncharacterized protein n=1 Tax=Stentor coeruleus TaxID=5963 RepID=A0A1R2BVP9_9CILI|nr:hypothetical protein SteCoe_18878 [Stentor coeruleus]
MISDHKSYISDESITENFLSEAYGITIKGHHSGVKSLAASIKNNILITSSNNKKICIWDIRKRCLLHVLKGHKSSINSVALSKNASFIISGSSDCTIRIWDLQQYTERFCFHCHGHPILCIALTSNENFIISGSYDKTIKIWNLKTYTQEAILKGHLDSIVTLLTTKSDMIISGSHDKTITLWNLSNKKAEHVFKGHTNEVLSLDITYDEKYMVSGSCDKTIRLWNLQQKRCLAEFIGHTSIIYAVCIRNDGKFAYSMSKDKSIRVWDLNKMQAHNIVTGHCGEIFAGKIVGGDKFLITCGADKMIMWDLENLRQICTFAGHTDNVTTCIITNDKKYALTGSKDKTIRIWDLKDGVEIAVFEWHYKKVRGISISSDDRIVISYSKYEIVIWSLPLRRKMFIITRLYPQCKLISQDGKHLFTASENLDVLIWDLQEKRQINVITNLPAIPILMNLKENNEEIAFACLNGIVQVWDLKSKSLKWKTLDKSSNITSMCFHPTKALFLISHSNNSLSVLKIPKTLPSTTPQYLSQSSSFISRKIIPCLEHEIRHKVFNIKKETSLITKDMKFITSRPTNNSINIINLNTGIPEIQIPEHLGRITCLSISKDQKLLVSGSVDNTIKIWDLVNNYSISTLLQHSAAIYCVVISQDSKIIVSGGDDCYIRVFNVCDQREIFKYRNKRHFVRLLCLSYDNEYIVFSSKKKTAKVLSLSKGIVIRKLIGHTLNINCIAASEISCYVITGAIDATVRIWNVEDGTEKHKIEGNRELIISANFARNDLFCVIEYYGGCIKVVNLEKNEIIRDIVFHENTIFTPDFSFGVYFKIYSPAVEITEILIENTSGFASGNDVMYIYETRSEYQNSIEYDDILAKIHKVSYGIDDNDTGFENERKELFENYPELNVLLRELVKVIEKVV